MNDKKAECMRWTGGKGNTTRLLHFMCPDLPDDAVFCLETQNVLRNELHMEKGDFMVRTPDGKVFGCREIV